MAVEKKVNEIVNRLEKTKDERYPDLAAEKESRDREERNEKKAHLQDMKRKEKDEMKRKKELEELRYYMIINYRLRIILYQLTNFKHSQALTTSDFFRSTYKAEVESTFF